jgi:hypothetical protein
VKIPRFLGHRDALHVRRVQFEEEPLHLRGRALQLAHREIRDHERERAGQHLREEPRRGYSGGPLSELRATVSTLVFWRQVG